MMRLMAVLWSLILCVVGLGADASAAIYNVACSGNITSALQSAINSTSIGDTVNIGAGSFSMSGQVTLTDDNITIQGAGQGVTNITANSGFATINISGANVPTFRITAMSFSGTANTVWLSI